MDPYATLKVPHTATIDEIKKAYRKMALKWHPDKNGGSLEAAEMFLKVKAAYDCLADPIKRKVEDQKRQQREHAESGPNARSRTSGQTNGQANHWQWAMRPLAVSLVLLAFIVMIAALFRTNNRGAASASA